MIHDLLPMFIAGLATEYNFCDRLLPYLHRSWGLPERSVLIFVRPLVTLLQNSSRKFAGRPNELVQVERWPFRTVIHPSKIASTEAVRAESDADACVIASIM